MKKSHVKPIPEGYPTLTPSLTVHNAAQAIEFYKKAFGAQERFRLPTPDGRQIAHAELKIGDSVFMLADEMPGQECKSPLALEGTPVGFTASGCDCPAVVFPGALAPSTNRLPSTSAAAPSPAWLSATTLEQF